MDRSVLTNDSARVDADDVVAGESLSHESQSTSVVLLLCVCRHDDSAVDDKEVGVGSRQTVAVVVERVGHRQTQQTIGLAVSVGGSLQLLLKSVQVGILRVVFVVATHIK